MKPHGCVYVIYFPNGKQYVGMTTRSLKSRMKCHMKKVNSSDKSKQRVVHRAIEKYGIKNCNISIVFRSDDKEELFDREIIEIAKRKRSGFLLYNMTDGGDGITGYVQTEEDRKKMSESLKGRVFTAEHRRKLSEAGRGHKRNLGKRLSAATRKKISEAHKGLRHTEETKKKLSEIGKRNTEFIKNLFVNRPELIGKVQETRIKNLEESGKLDEVRRIKKDLDDGIKSSDIAKKYGLSQSTICDIKKGRSYSYVK